MSDTAALPAPAQPVRAAAASRWRSDLLGVAAVTLGCWLLAAAVELRELSSLWLARYEGWQADELPFAFGVLACGLAWYAVRRRRETQAELLLREEAQAQAQALLAHNRELARQLITLQESERLVLARELHDELGQSCAAIRVETAFIRNGMATAAGDDAGLLAAAARADAAAQGLYEGVRGLLRRLRPANLDTLGLVAAMQELCEAWSERAGLPCIFTAEGLATPLPDAVNITLYRVAQEALTNVLQHARAGSVRVVLARLDAHEVQLMVQDDGCGIDLRASTRGLGLLGASERAAALGGTLRLSSAGPGTRLLLRIPASTPVQAAP
jgi:glucose-6-phosphate-specific signal transduction histidine kinase